jgi:hypothetical protein
MRVAIRLIRLLQVLTLRPGIALPTLALLLASHLGAAGRDLAPQRLDTPIGGVASAATISNGSSVAWLWTVEALFAGKHVYGAITEISGAVRAPARAVWPYIDQNAIGVTAAPGGYVLYRRDATGVQQRTISDDGVLGDPVRVAAMQDDRSFAPPPVEATRMPALQEGPRLASSGSGFLAVWTERGGTSQSIVARTLDRDRNPVGAALDLTRVAGSIGDYNVAFGGGLSAPEYLVIWQNGSQIFGSRVAAGGIVIDRTPFVIATITIPGRFGIASDGNDFLVAWAEGSAVYGTIVTADAHVAAARVLIPAEGQSRFTEPVVAFDGARYVVASIASAPLFPCYNCLPSSLVKAIRVGRDGAPLDSSATTVAAAPRPAHLAIASSGHDLLVTFVSSETIFATTLHADTTLRADSPVSLFHWIDEPSTSPSVARSGDDYVVAFRYAPQGFDFDGTGEWYLGTIRLNADGSRGALAATITGPPRELEVEPPGIASTFTGDIAIAVSEAREPGEMPRAVSYAVADLQPVTHPTAPSPAWQQSRDGKTLVVSWPDVWNDERGFFLRLFSRDGAYEPSRIPPGATSASVPWPPDLTALELRVWNKAGFASTRVPIAIPRIRAVRK